LAWELVKLLVGRTPGKEQFGKGGLKAEEEEEKDDQQLGKQIAPNMYIIARGFNPNTRSTVQRLSQFLPLQWRQQSPKAARLSTEHGQQRRY